MNSVLPHVLTILCVLMFVSFESASGMTPDEGCEHCQRVMYFAFKHYANSQSTKRGLRHRFKHLCRRYPKYRPHCLTTIVAKSDNIRDDMESALKAGHFKPLKTCQWLKECEYVAFTLLFLLTIDTFDKLEGSGIDLYFDVD
jgi:hypothetical protein